MQINTMAKIILAEDDDDMRRFLVKALEKAGHHVTAFGEGASAFEEIKQTTFDLLLTDIVMPEMGGRRSAEQVLLLRPDLKVLYMSGYAGPEHPAEPGALVQKPFTPESLARKVREVLDG